MREVCFIHNEKSFYPDSSMEYRPECDYPEYLFHHQLSSANCVYEMIREGFVELGLDIEHFGSENWNPLGEYIHPGDNVLIKPNMVMHYNPDGGGVDCLYTNPSLVAPVIDYVLIALGGIGRIVIGDAPLQECDFNKLLNNSGYNNLLDFYRRNGVDIEIVDFRNVKTYEKEGIHYYSESKKDSGVVVNLDEDSAFHGTSEEVFDKLRITNYDPRVMKRHHYGKHHQYRVAEEVLAADVIINMPKPKTHRKAGVTISLKNLVGINANKEYLPHHTFGSVSSGGDAFLSDDIMRRLSDEMLDIKNILISENRHTLAQKAEELYRLMIDETTELYSEGSWYGNNTIWKTIIDLNTIVFYADKKGVIRNEKQRKMLVIADMIVSGEGEGPLKPFPVQTGTIVFGDDPIMVDMAVCSFMGFDYNDIPSIRMPGLESLRNRISEYDFPVIISNNNKWDRKSIEAIRTNSFRFLPSKGWQEKLGNPLVEDMIEKLKRCGNSVYIFGAGENGLFVYKALQQQGVTVLAFCDNNEKKNNTIVIDGIKCIIPSSVNRDYPVIVGVGKRYQDEVIDQLEKMGISVLGVGCL